LRKCRATWIALLPFNYPTTLETDSFGGILITDQHVDVIEQDVSLLDSTFLLLGHGRSAAKLSTGGKVTSGPANVG
jgi:hypothetical protein